MLGAVASMAALVLPLGLGLGWAAVRLRGEGFALRDTIDALLPQTQCGQCGFPGCKPYAAAIATGEADIDRCPPGGDNGVRQLAALLGRMPKPVDRARGTPGPGPIARIDEARCIGCTRCILVCPVDAIVGATKQMHTVIEAECTGCKLCLPPCPVDCIELIVSVPHRDVADAHAVVQRIAT